jgi:Tfp pilus assembly protein PilV
VKRSFTSCSGTSLAETLIAIAILAFALLALAQLFIISGAVLRRANDLSMAAILAAQKLEELRTTASGAADATSDGVEFVDAAGIVHPVADVAGVPAYTRRWSVRSLPADAAVRIVQVRVTPGRHDGTPVPGAASAVALITAFARDTP